MNKFDYRLPLISIITACYNAESTIEKTINSVINQSYADFEYIIIDGNSTDNTLRVVSEYKEQISLIISEPDSGISEAFNKGINLSKGRIIGIINAGDWYYPGVLKKIARYDRSNTIYHGNLSNHDRHNNVYNIRKSRQGAEMDLMKCKMGELFHPTIFVTKNVYEKNLFNVDYQYAMDYDLLLRSYLGGVEFKYIDKVIASMNTSGVSEKFYHRAKLEVIESYRKRTNTIVDKHIIFSIFSILKNITRKIFERINMNFLVDFYRSKLK